MSRIEINNVSKSFKDTLALDNVSLCFEEGKIYGLLGRNGAGKSTLINIMTNRMFATSGGVLIDGEPAAENDAAQQKIFCMSEKSGYPGDMRVSTAFKYAKGYYPGFDTEYAYALAERFGLNTRKAIKTLSTGYNSICKLIMTLASNADVYIFDEPALGLDATVRDLFYGELLQNYSANPRTIIISTHLIEEVAELLEHVVILHGGKAIIDKSLEEVLANAYTLTGKADDVDSFTASREVLKTVNIGSLKTVTVMGRLSAEDKKRLKETSLEATRANLQEVFVSLTR